MLKTVQSLPYDEYVGASAACGGAITTSVGWKLTKVGNLVTLTLPPVQGTASAASNFYFGTLIPSQYRPSNVMAFPCAIKDNGANQASPGMVYIEVGRIYVYKDLTSGGNFTAGATSGLAHGAGFSMSWTI